MARGESSIQTIASAFEDEPQDLLLHSSPDGVVTLMFSDVENSTAMMERLGELRSFAVLRQHKEIVGELVQGDGGRIVKSQGDGFMIAFPSARGALRCAIAMQRAFAERVLGDGERLRIRIGLHAGEVIPDENDFFGRNVVLAARIADRARGGEILVSSELKQYTETDRSFAFELLGELELKGLLGSHAVYSVPWGSATS